MLSTDKENHIFPGGVALYHMNKLVLLSIALSIPPPSQGSLLDPHLLNHLILEQQIKQARRH
jgi:hypothetical protein